MKFFKHDDLSIDIYETIFGNDIDDQYLLLVVVVSCSASFRELFPDCLKVNRFPPLLSPSTISYTEGLFFPRA